MSAPNATARGLPAESPPPGRSGAWLICEYLLIVWRRFLVSSIATAIVNPLLYLLALGFGLGTLVDNGPGAAALGGVAYVRYIAPALLTAAALQTGVSVAAYPVLAGFVWEKVFWGMTATPILPRQIAYGQLIYFTLRMLVGSVFYYLVVLAFGAAGRPAGALAIGVATLTGLSCSVWVMAFAAMMKSEGNGFNLIFRLVLVPMTLFSGSFFPVDQLPAVVRPLAWISPLWHGNELSRTLMLGGGGWIANLGHLAFLVVLGVVGMVAATRTFTKRLIV